MAGAPAIRSYSQPPPSAAIPSPCHPQLFPSVEVVDKTPASAAIPSRRRPVP